jgi:hypothetical protein
MAASCITECLNVNHDSGQLSRYSDLLRAGRSDNRGSIRGGGWEFFSSTLCSDRLWDPTSLLPNAYRGLFPWGQSGRGVEITHLPLVPRSNKAWSYTSIPHTPPKRLRGVVLS